MATVHRQLLSWCRRRSFDGCEAFVEKLDDRLRPEADLSPEVLLRSCRKIRTPFFRQNKLDREEAAGELAGVLELPPVASQLVRLHTDRGSESNSSLPETNLQCPDLFLSYYHQDYKFVEAVASAVHEKGFSVWYDRAGLTAGSNFPSEIERALEVTRYIGVVCTPTSVKRPWVVKEVNAGHVRENEENREILIPLRLAPGKFPLFIRAKNWCDFTSSFETGLTDLVNRLGR